VFLGKPFLLDGTPKQTPTQGFDSFDEKFDDGPEDELPDEGVVELVETPLVVVAFAIVVVDSTIDVLVVVVGNKKLLDKYAFVRTTRFE